MSDIAERSLHTRAARSVEALRRSFLDNLYYITGRSLQTATPVNIYTALAYTVRDRLLERFINTTENYRLKKAKQFATFLLNFCWVRTLATTLSIWASGTT